MHGVFVAYHIDRIVKETGKLSDEEIAEGLGFDVKIVEALSEAQSAVVY